MPRVSRLLPAFLALTLATHAAAASAHWAADGSGSGAGSAATMPAGVQPAATATGQEVTVAWTQSAFASRLLGSYTGGGYNVRRYAATGTGATAADTGCAGTISGTATTLQCVESAVPYGLWRYAVTPVLGTFTGDEGAKSATVTVAPPAPSLVTARSQNPGPAQTTGDIAIAWDPVPGAAGYNVYRRVAPGSYDFASAVNGAAPVRGSTYTDAGAGLTGATTYHYVVRAVAGSPAVESPDSTDQSATAIARPAAPSGAPTAVAGAGGRIDVGWNGVADASGYNVYRRPATGSYDFAAPVNGATPVSAPAWADTTAIDATTYLYTVRAVKSGAGGSALEGASSAESSPATSDAVAPAAPSALAVGGAGNVLTSTTCGVASGTRYVNAAGQAAVAMTATVPGPEAGASVVFSAMTSGPAPVIATVPAASTSVPASLNLGTLPDGAVSLTARTRDAAGNLSAAVAPANAIVKDTAVPPLSITAYSPNLLGSATISGSSECGATIRATETQPSAKTYPPVQVAPGPGFTLTVDGPTLVLGGPFRFNVTATDLAGNTTAPVQTGN
jgi:hypothetical protein